MFAIPSSITLPDLITLPVPFTPGSSVGVSVGYGAWGQEHGADASSEGGRRGLVGYGRWVAYLETGTRVYRHHSYDTDQTVSGEGTTSRAKVPGYYVPCCQYLTIFLPCVLNPLTTLIISSPLHDKN